MPATYDGKNNTTVAIPKKVLKLQNHSVKKFEIAKWFVFGMQERLQERTKSKQPRWPTYRSFKRSKFYHELFIPLSLSLIQLL